MNAVFAGLLLLLAWDASGLDLRLMRWFGDAHGFALRDSWWAANVLHDGGRMAAWALLAVLAVRAVAAWRAPGKPFAAGADPRADTSAGAPSMSRPSRRQRLWWLAVMLLCAVVVPVFKRFSSTSCPWDLAEFGGVAAYVSHWQLGLADGGAGRCFPSGHAVAAFSFFGMVWLWQPHDPRRARLWLLGVLAAGALFGTAQMVRGAHYPSHTLWTAWLCWTLCASAQALAQLKTRLKSRSQYRPSAAGGSTMGGPLAGAPDDTRYHRLDRPDPRPLET